jgi:PRC-barrel domain
MQRFALSLLAAGVALSVGGAAFAQGTPRPLDVPKIDVVKVATGFRATRIIGETVVNDANEIVGKVDDLIIVPDAKGPVLILSVGGFLGVGTRLVAVPYESFKMQDRKLLLTGAAKDTLSNLPEFKYAPD